MAAPADKTRHQLEQRLRHAAQALDDAKAERAQAILAASAHGMSRRAVAEHAGITYGRVQQILREPAPPMPKG